MGALEQLLLLGKTALALVLGGVIGYERDVADKPAGIRTHMLVAGSAYLFMVLGEALMAGPRLPDEELVSADPLRLLQAIVVGISFIGAGTILKRSESETVENLTTAASILVASTLGIALALDHYVLAFGVVALVLLVNRLIYQLKGRLGEVEQDE